MDPRELAIQSAIQGFNSGVYSSKAAAAKAYGIPRSTLVSRMNGSSNARIGHEQQQQLTPLQVEFLTE